MAFEQLAGQRRVALEHGIGDGSVFGHHVAHLRSGFLVRCNHRFERMLGLAAGAGAGAGLESLFTMFTPALPTARAAAQAVAQDQEFDAEVPFDNGRDGPRWYTLSLRPAPRSRS